MDFKHLFFSFEGRINRAKWWLSVVVIFVAVLLVGLVLLPTLGDETAAGETTLGPGASILLTLILAYPITAVTVKRLKDRDRPLWLAALFWTPTALSLIGELTGLTYSLRDVGGQTVALPNTFGWLVVAFSAVIGIWSLVELGILKGTQGPNRWGPDPLAR